MEGQSFTTIHSDPTLLLVDLDRESPRFSEMFRMIDELYGIQWVESWYSKSGAPNRHVLIGMTETLTIPERIALQAILGSDAKREILSLKRHADVDNPVILFQPPNANIERFEGENLHDIIERVWSDHNSSDSSHRRILALMSGDEAAEGEDLYCEAGDGCPGEVAGTVACDPD
jgi:hypothetical protein